MTTMTMGFIGGGRITRIFLEGWERAGRLPERIVVSDINEAALATLKARFSGVATSAQCAVAAAQDIVLLAVHPPVIADVAEGIKGCLKPGAVLVSLAPKFTFAKLAALLGGFGRLVRMIPNAPSIVNHGFNPIAFGPALTLAEKAEVTDLFSPLGECPEVAEEKLEAYAVLSAQGPTFLWFQLQALREVVAEFGLSEAEIAPALKRMVCGATRTLLDSGLPPADVMNLIPVKPLAEMEAQVTNPYKTRLAAIYQKIKP